MIVGILILTMICSRDSKLILAVISFTLIFRMNFDENFQTDVPNDFDADCGDDVFLLILELIDIGSGGPRHMLEKQSHSRWSFLAVDISLRHETATCNSTRILRGPASSKMATSSESSNSCFVLTV